MSGMNELLRDSAKNLQDSVEAGTMNGFHSYLGFLGDFARDADFVQNGCKGDCIPNTFNTRPNAEHRLGCPVWKVFGVGS